MRLKIELVLANHTIDVNYKSMLQGAIYKTFGDDQKIQELHDQGARIENRPFKLFVFSDLIGQAIFEPKDKTLHFLSNGYLLIDAYDQNLIERVYRNLLKETYFQIGKQFIEIKEITIQNLKLIHKEKEIILKSISPVIVNRTVDKRMVYLDPTDDDYLMSIYQNLSKKWMSIYGSSTHFRCPQIEIVSSKRKSVYFRKVFYIAYDLVIKVCELTPSVYDLMMKTGIGSKNSLGFGMLEHDNKFLSIV